MNDQPIDEAGARARAIAHAEAHHADLARDRQWRVRAFDGGWLVTPTGDDLRWLTGVRWFVVLADGSIHETSSSMGPPQRVIDEWRRGGPRHPDPSSDGPAGGGTGTSSDDSP